MRAAGQPSSLHSGGEPLRPREPEDMIAVFQAGEVHPDGARDTGAGDWGSDGGSSREVMKAGGGYGECG